MNAQTFYDVLYGNTMEEKEQELQIALENLKRLIMDYHEEGERTTEFSADEMGFDTITMTDLRDFLLAYFEDSDFEIDVTVEDGLFGEHLSGRISW